MEKDAFAKLLDNSWQTFRQQLLEAFPDDLGVHHTSSLKSPKVDHHSSFKSRKVMESAGVSEITEIDEDVYIAKGMHATEALQTSQRLRVRLGAITSMKLVSGQSLHDAVSSADGTFESDNPYGTPVWSWPSATSQSFRKSVQNVAVTSFTPRRTYNLVPAQALMELFLAEEGGIHKRLFGPRLMTQFQAMKEILLAGDTNRLVAELTFVRINDLATPPEPTHPLMYIEPFVGLLIVCNGIMIGFQTDPLFENWPGWIWFELAFASILLMEIGLRMHLLRCRGYWWGPERLWNWFDVFLAGTGVSDVTIQIATWHKTIPNTMFTAFRCFTGECVNHQGHSITSLLADEFGVIFILSFVASYMLVTMGIFNVILAVYVDITMKAAKEELLKKFAAAHRDFMAMEEAFDFTGKNFNPMPALFTDDDVHEQIEISKELFLVVIQDHSVQRLMDDLDLPPDRANLFEVIDADGSGTLHITELVQGLLKIRGDISKSDTVASLLATKAVQRIDPRSRH
eukprot:g29667.t1